MGEIVRKVGSKYGLDPNSDFLTVVNMVRRAFGSSAEGGEFDNQQGYIGNPAKFPLDWSLYGQRAKYGYRVKVTFTDTISGDSWHTVVVVTSDTAITGADIAQDAIAQAVILGRTGTTTQPFEGSNNALVIDAEIISAGRRP